MNLRSFLFLFLAAIGLVLGPQLEHFIYGSPKLIADFGEQYERAAVSPDAKKVIGLKRTSSGWSVQVVDLKGANLLGPIEVADPPARAQTFDWDRSGRWAVFGGASELHIFDLTKKTVTRLDAPPLVRQVAIRANVLMSRSDEIIQLWDISSGRLILRLKEAYLIQADLSSDGKTLAIGCFEEGVKIVDVRSGKIRRHLSKGWTPAGIKFCHQGRWLSTALRAGDHQRDRARLFDVASGRQLGPDISAPNLRGMSVNTSGDRLLLRTSENAVIVEPATGREICRTALSSLFIDSLSPNGALAATNAVDSTDVTVWNGSNGKTVSTLSHPSPTTDVRFADDHLVEVVGGRYRLWQLR